jgi:hypothetical protein
MFRNSGLSGGLIRHCARKSQAEGLHRKGGACMEAREEKPWKFERVIVAVAGPVSRLVGTTMWLRVCGTPCPSLSWQAYDHGGYKLFEVSINSRGGTTDAKHVRTLRSARRRCSTAADHQAEPASRRIRRIWRITTARSYAGRVVCSAQSFSDAHLPSITTAAQEPPTKSPPCRMSSLVRY